MPFRFVFVLAFLSLTGNVAGQEAGAVPDGAQGSVPFPPAATGDTALLSARRMETKDGHLDAEGDVELRQGDQVIRADRLTYSQASQDMHATGHVRVERPGVLVTGPELFLNLGSYRGEMFQPEFSFKERGSRGMAEQVHILGKLNYTFDRATYTTCPAGNDDWLLHMRLLEIDRQSQIGVAHHAYVEFKGLPILYTPWMDFTLDGRRRSGFLGPTFGNTNQGGAEVTLPYYWNIAPNYDATIAPRRIARRGTQLNNEFRFLSGVSYSELQYDVLPYDQLAGRQRHRASLKHSQSLGGGVMMALDLNGVSDDNYFRDLSTSVSGTSQVNLLREGVLTYSAGWWNTSARVQRFQTLQDPLAPVAVPYRREPQVNLTAQREVAGAKGSFFGEYVDFRHDTAINARRWVLYPSVSYPLLADPGYYLTPRLGVHHTVYHMGANTPAGLGDATRTLPIFSLDSGLVFERDDSFLGNAYVQTLEPRLYYVYIPYRDQSTLPVFDTAQTPFGFGQIFTENRFSGNDRVGDANAATLALTTRVIDGQTGTERLHMVVAERFSFDTPRVNLVTPSGNLYRSDILVGLGGQMTDALSLDGLVQYNPHQSYTESYNLSAHYRPEPGKVLNWGYRFTRKTLHQTDVSSQWPFFGNWQVVARLNYSLQDRRALEALGGLEYNEACWSMRFVAQSFTTATLRRTIGVFVQLELNDFVRIGSDPLDTLRNSISGYTKKSGSDTGPAAR